MDCDIAVLIPCYNEEKTIKNVVNALCKMLSSAPPPPNIQSAQAFPAFKIFVYDNNSTDNTFGIVQSMNNPFVVCRKELRQGKGYVVRSMFQNIDANCYILIDGDDTYPIENCIEMIRLIKEESFDMVNGDRLSTNYHKVNSRRFHSFGNLLVSTLINTFFHSNIRDIMTGYRAFSRKFVKTSGLLACGFEIETEMTILALDGNYKIIEIPIIYKERPEGSFSKLNTFKDGFKVIKTIFILFKDYRSLEFFLIIFLILSIVGFSLFIPVFTEYLQTGLVQRFPTLFVSIFFWILAILSMCLGIVLSTITKMFKRNKEIYQINFK